MTKISRLATIVPVLCLGLFMSACTTTSHTADSDHQREAYHTGPIEPADLLARYPIFATNKKNDESKVTDLEVLDLANQLNNKKIVVVFGTWCHDSQREVPRLLNLIDKVKQQYSDVQFETQFIAAAPFAKRDKNLIKKYDLTAVPTILIYDNGQEVGRVVEQTKLSLVVDIVGMKL